MEEKLKGAIFDLDGTLLDTIDDICDAVNDFLAEEGFPTHSLEDMKGFIGSGTMTLLKKALPPDFPEGDIEKKVLGLSLAYGAHLTKKTKPFDGALELLEELQKRRVPLAVLSNKGNDFVQTLIGYYFPDIFFHAVVGITEGVPVKPDPAGAKFCLSIMKLKPGQVFYCGDSGVDMVLAKNLGMYGAGALWGYRTSKELTGSGAKILLNTPMEALKLF